MFKKLCTICFFVAGLLLFCTANESNTANDLLRCFTFNASAQEYRGSCGTNLTWSFNDATGKLTISGSGNKYDTNKPWSAYNNSITSIEIEEGVTSTTNFKNMPNLRTVVLADSVTTITRYSFSNCASLQTVTFGRNLKLIDEFAFNLTSPTAIYYPGTEEEFSKNVTVNDVESSQMDAIFTVLIHEYQTPNAHFDSYYVNIGLKVTIYLDGRMVITGSGNRFSQSFYSEDVQLHHNYLDKVTSLTFPESVTDIFIDLRDFTNLTEINLPSNLTHLEIYNIEYTKFYRDQSNWENNLLYHGKYVLCSNGATVLNIKEGTEFIATRAFSDTALTDITIPDSVKIIDNDAFEWCESLSNIEIPDGVTYIGYAAFNGTALEKVIIPDSVTHVGGFAFGNCTALTEVSYPLSAYLDARGPFINRVNIQKVTVTAGYGTPYDYTGDDDETDKVYFPIAPWYRANEAEVEFAEGVKKIPDKIFTDGLHVKKITIPSTVETISDTAFYRLYALEEICVSEQSPYFKVDEYGVLMTKDNKKIIFCPVNKNLTEYDIPQGTEHIFRNAFCAHTTLKKITLPDSLKTIGEYAFYECKGLEKVIIPDSVYLISEGAFGYCESINELVLPKDIQSLGRMAFYKCLKVKKVFIPSSLTNAGEDSLILPKLTDIYYEGTKEQWDALANKIGATFTNLINQGTTVHYEHKHTCSEEMVIMPTHTATGTKKCMCYCSRISYEDIPKLKFEICDGIVVDPVKKVIYGFNPGDTSMDNYTILPEGYSWFYMPGKYGYGTDASVHLTDGRKIIESYEIIVFGDVDGNAVYDANDAFLVNMIISGTITEDMIGKTAWEAADCNHDGVIDNADFDILTSASVLHEQIQQSKNNTNIALNSLLSEYLALIDQSAGNSVEITPPQESQPESSDGEISILTFIIELIKIIISMLAKVF